jgi:polysaccharide chain length determinant protein (PEP-CTERM system associated)
VTDDPQTVLASYIDVIYRHRIAALCALVLGMALTVFAVITLPNLYQSSTLITIEPRFLPAGGFSLSPAGHLRHWVEVLGEQVSSRNRLERLIAQDGLYARWHARHVPIEEIADHMRAHINILIPRGKQWDDSLGGAFTISYEYPDPRIAQRITATLARMLIEEALHERAIEAAAATRVLKGELARTRTQLESKGTQIKRFKESFRGSLPADLDLDLKTLAGLQGQLQSAQESRERISERRLQLDRDAVREHEQNVSPDYASGGKPPLRPEATLRSMDTELTVLRAQYSDRYPDVVQLKAEIGALKARLKTARDGGSSPLDRELRKERNALTLDDVRLKKQAAALRAEIAEYQQHLAAIPGHEQQLADLTRDYAVLAEQYHQILNEKLAAEMAQRVEQVEGPQRYRVLEAADLPRNPISPNRLACAAVGIALTLLFATGLPFVLYYADSSIKCPDGLRYEYGARMVASIPNIAEIEPRSPSVARAFAISCACFMLGAVLIRLYATRSF